MTFFNEKITVRLRDRDLERMEDYVEKHKDIYDNVSHFMRAAALEKLKRGEWQNDPILSEQNKSNKKDRPDA